MSGEKVTRRNFLARSAGASTGAALAAASYRRVLGANERIGVGFIGTGGRSRAHRNVVKRLKEKGMNVEQVAFCDVYRPRLEKAAEGTSGRTYMDHHELLADSAVDVVCIATPDHLHPQQVMDAVEAGKDVYCEKPISHWTQFEITKKMAHLVREKEAVFQAGTQYMANPEYHEAARQVAEGAIGQPVHAQCGYFRVGDWGERGMPIDDPNAKAGPDLIWERFLGTAPKRPFDVSRFFRWRMYEDYAGGPSTDLFPHVLTPVASVLGVGFPEKVVAVGGKFRYQEREIPDTFNMLIDYPEKITVAVLGTQANNHGIPELVRGWDATVFYQRPGIVLEPTQESKKKRREVAVERKATLGGEWVDVEEHWINFLECTRTREQPEANVDLAYHVQTALQMGMLSLREEKVARFDADKEEIVL